MELFAGLFIVFVGNDRPNTMVTTLDRFKLMVASKLYALFAESMQFVHPIIMNCPRWIVHVINVYCERKDHITKTNCERKDHITKLNKFKYDDETAKPNRNSLDLRDWNHPLLAWLKRPMIFLYSELTDQLNVFWHLYNPVANSIECVLAS
eukprot:1077314_1